MVPPGSYSSKSSVHIGHVLIGLLVVLLWAGIPTRAQDSSTGVIRGVVKDTAGALIPDASVVVRNGATGIRHSTLTSGEGVYVFELLQPGDYTGCAEAPGMSPQTTPALHLEVGRDPAT